ncbi:Rrf2 family transcriptional regulator [Marinococcus halophilus]|uniref:Transcriptional regulator n=1 Tax=Marinococcus halophilus TaxID=1371 RepID=A0A510Y1M1_MARHA|nr:Rrf2 family transcriptional regulator [Marinococcus halophilus]OZT81265.1 Rrf2 family transcriptional regulator [Marinococcus halophilus]GEK57208.1 transcriptional regulator [Marinococcus halophilus]
MNSHFSLAVHSLTLLAHQSERAASSSFIAESASVHPVRIRKVLSLLKQHGLIRSKEGAGGGFVLSRPPEAVTLWDVYQITSKGTLQPRCPEENPSCDVGANMKHVLGGVFSDGESVFGEHLDQYTIADMLKKCITN